MNDINLKMTPVNCWGSKQGMTQGGTNYEASQEHQKEKQIEDQA